MQEHDERYKRAARTSYTCLVQITSVSAFVASGSVLSYSRKKHDWALQYKCCKRVSARDVVSAVSTNVAGKVSPPSPAQVA